MRAAYYHDSAVTLYCGDAAELLPEMPAIDLCVTSPPYDGLREYGGHRDDLPGARMRHVIPISGKDSLATAIWQKAHRPELPYEYVFNDTVAELPETYEWLDKVERELEIKIERIGKSLKDIIREQGILPSPRTRFCTKYAKIFPMRDFIGKEGAICYFGLRADEPERVGAMQTRRLTPAYPLRDAGIGLATVYRIVRGRNLMPPDFFWQRLFDEVKREMGAIATLMLAGWQQWQIDRTFAWRSRPNCFFCFFQRRYEWVGLLEHHPELFAEAEAIEASAGNGDNLRRSTGIRWIAEDYPLSKIREEASTIFTKRVKAVCRIIDLARQTDLFADSLDEMDIAGTSCGLLCGK